MMIAGARRTTMLVTIEVSASRGHAHELGSRRGRASFVMRGVGLLRCFFDFASFTFFHAMMTLMRARQKKRMNAAGGAKHFRLAAPLYRTTCARRDTP